MNILTKQLVLPITLFLTFSNAWAERVLIDDADQRIHVSDEIDCYGSAEISIDTVRPELFEPDSDRLQRLVDATRAMLNYECPELSEINITGIIRGLQEPVYRGKISRQGDWILPTQALPYAVTHPTISDEYPAGSQGPVDPFRTSNDDSTLSLTKIQLGMEVGQVSDIVNELFKSAPLYDGQQGLMTLSTGGCPSEFDIEVHKSWVQSDWKCLKAHFSDRRIAQLEQLELIQVAKGSIESVYRVLIDRYGSPLSHTDIMEDRTELIWQSDKGHTLQAILHELDGQYTVTDMKLFQHNTAQAGLNITELGLML